jgi:hypothetical protein
MLRETQQASSGVLALELSNGDLDECSASVEESDDDMSSFIAAGGESGLGAARTLIAQGAVRNYRAFSNMGYHDHLLMLLLVRVLAHEKIRKNQSSRKTFSEDYCEIPRRAGCYRTVISSLVNSVTAGRETFSSGPKIHSGKCIIPIKSRMFSTR